MGLVAALSNTQTEILFRRLTGRDWRQVHRPPPRRHDQSRDGKLKFGTVSGAVVAVLAEAGGPLRYIEIDSRVELSKWSWLDGKVEAGASGTVRPTDSADCYL